MDYNRAREQIFNQSGAGKTKGKDGKSKANEGVDSETGTSGEKSSEKGNEKGNKGNRKSKKPPVAIFHDRDKDRYDPDFNRNMDRWEQTCAVAYIAETALFFWLVCYRENLRL